MPHGLFHTTPRHEDSSPISRESAAYNDYVMEVRPKPWPRQAACPTWIKEITNGTLYFVQISTCSRSEPFVRINVQVGQAALPIEIMRITNVSMYAIF